MQSGKSMFGFHVHGDGNQATDDRNIAYDGS